MKVLITGANGYLGQILTKHLLDQRHQVVAFSRAEPRGYTGHKGFYWQQWELGKDIDLAGAGIVGGAGVSNVDNVDWVIHAAHDFNASAEKLNIDGTKELFMRLRNAGVRRQAFISSYSARHGSPSLYGRIKYSLEQFFLAQGETIVRPGLVIGYGGLFGRNVDRLLRSRLVPLLDGGHDLVPIISEKDFVLAMTKILETDLTGSHNLFNYDLLPMSELIQKLLDAAEHKAIFIPIPISIAVGALSIARFVGIRLPVDIGNLQALKANQKSAHHSNLDRLVTSPQMPDAMMIETVSQRKRTLSI